MDIKIIKASVNFESFVDENKLITENFNRILNNNWEVGTDLVMPQLKKIGELVMKKYTNSFFEKVPFDEIFLK